MEELKRLIQDLNQNEDLRRKFDETLGRIADEGQAQNDGEIFVKAAKELGYEITIAALERNKAEIEELDENELEAASGGEDGDMFGCTKNHLCMKDYECLGAYITDSDDEYGHSGWCVTAWHCYAVTLHTDTESKKVNCWVDYRCGIIQRV